MFGIQRAESNIMSEIDQFYGPNAGYVIELYDRYRANPDDVDAATRALFSRWNAPAAPYRNGNSAPAPAVAPSAAPPPALDVTRIVLAARFCRMTRELGHRAARIDPLGNTPPGDPELDLAYYGLTETDLASLPASVVGGPLAQGAANCLEALDRLRRVYSGPVGYETDHIQDPAERAWLYEAAETERFFKNFDAETKRQILERLTEVDSFEQFIHKTFQGSKRFSIEGTDMLVPMLDEITRLGADADIKEIVIGMAHRGRLNVLAHVMGKPYAAIVSGFESVTNNENATEEDAGISVLTWTGDVKYHLGYERAIEDRGQEKLLLTLVPNPSHLEFVNPVVEGHTRAAQDECGSAGAPKQDDRAALAVLIHGDAAFPGQGVVAETLNLSRLSGYQTGGSLHIIANNQIGFTTNPGDGRSTLYAGDLAKGFEIPIVHVNADDPIACLAVVRMAHEYRERFQKDFLIDLIGYRRYGHNEGEEPAFTQPQMYANIRQHPRVREIFAAQLAQESLVTTEEADALVAQSLAKLTAARTADHTNGNSHDDMENASRSPRSVVETGVSAELLTALNESLLALPEDFAPNEKLAKLVLQKRRECLTKPNGIDWGHAETLAYASILADGTPIRLSGQDSERGTFGHRNAVLHDPNTDKTYTPLQHIPQAKASFAVCNSPLSENAVLGFEYGYSMHAPNVLTLWEAQFGDFNNGAQVIIDQFLVSGNAKWRQTPSLVLLLPHGYEGAGPEHSSARIERFLQMAATDNIRIVNCTTGAQFFHLLRRQAATLKSDPRPLIVMTPKSLLRDSAAASSLSDLTSGTFQPILDDAQARGRANAITRLVLCSGKVYHDLVKRATEEERESVALARLEELYPFPADEIKAMLAGYPNLQEIVWLQEEPCNMGAWLFVAPRLKDREMVGWKGELTYVGRSEAASPAEGAKRRHDVEQARILNSALRDIPALPKKPKLAMR